MADPILDNIVLIVVVLVMGLAVLTFIELRYLRKTAKGRRIKAAQSAELPDRAHNAILTSKAISQTLSTGGVVTAPADDLVREAEVAYRNRNYRVVIELTDQAKSIMKTEKARHDQMGDLARLQKTGDSGATETTTKEVLQKEIPPYYMQAKFTISLAEEHIQAARGAGRDTVLAAELLRTARATFDGKDYEGAFRQAVKSRRMANGETAPEPTAAVSAPPGTAVVPPPGTPARLARTCASCGSELKPDDTFCRKCGVKVERPTTCGTCGADLLGDEAFCRKCGTPVT
jgi:ribosomal protein L40E